MSDISGVESPGLIDVTGALDDGSAIGEDRELMPLGVELQVHNPMPVANDIRGEGLTVDPAFPRSAAIRCVWQAAIC